MTRIRKHLSSMGVFITLVMLVGCTSPAPTSAPTQDLNPFRTEVAATVFAQVTRDLALTPSPTTLPTFTLAPSATATLAPTPAASETISGTVALVSGTPEVVLTNRAQWVSQSIPDDTVFAPGETFTITWQIKNVGDSTWTAEYLFRYYSGEKFGAPEEFPLGQIVLPGQTVEISISMKAPITPGNYRTDWVLSDETRSNFKDPVFLKIVVAKPVTPSPTP